MPTRKTEKHNNVPLIKSTTSAWFDWVTHDPLTYSTAKYTQDNGKKLLLFSEVETKIKQGKNGCPFPTKEIKPSLTEYLDNNIILKNAGSLSGSAYEHKKRGKETKENQKNDNNTKTKEQNQILPIIMRKCKINKCGNIRRDK